MKGEVTEVNRTIIGISDYGSNLHPLEFCRYDGDEMYNLLKKLDYKILDNHCLIGYVKYETMRDAVYDFFTGSVVQSEDTLLFYYFGHGIPVWCISCNV